MSDSVRSETRDDVHHIELDDGKANALSVELIGAVQAALDVAEKQASAVLISGRAGRFSAGFDLAVMGKGGSEARGLVSAGAELCLRLLEFPRPVVVAGTGHAIAGGALLLASGDLRLQARGEFKIALNEVAIGIALPHFGREIARARLSKRHLVQATTQSRTYTPEQAVDAGFADALVEPDALLGYAHSEAQRLGGLSGPAFAMTKRGLQAGVVEHIRSELAADLEGLLPG